MGLINQNENFFVGRQQEMAVLETALNDAVSGQGRIVMLAGEPGIGKTRTAQELASRAESLGAQVIWGWCYDQEGAPPYWPWVQTVRAYISVTEPDQLRAGPTLWLELVRAKPHCRHRWWLLIGSTSWL